VQAPLPDWVFKGPVAEAGGVHTGKGSWSPAPASSCRAACCRSTAPDLPELLLGEGGPRATGAGKTVFEDKALRTWTLDGEVLIASIKTKMHAISPRWPRALEAWMRPRATTRAGDLVRQRAVLGRRRPGSHAARLRGGGADLVGSMEQELQDLMLRLRYAQVPVVAAIRGMALGGGCELAVHCARRVAHMESYIGLVEVGVGLVPGGGGLTYIARRAAENAQASTGKDLLPFLTEGFTAAAMAKVGTSASSRASWATCWSDMIVPHKDEVLHVAINEAKAMAPAAGAPLKRLFPVAGRTARPPSRASWSTCATAASSARTTFTSPA
jgi:3-hydroxyacyl-CoA dehydrogenase